MKNLMKKIRKSNKGFTLVELIIVIAIIAVLTAVAAPQYIKYVDKGRLAKDQNTAASIQTVVEAALVDLNSDAIDTNDVTAGTVTYDASGTAVAITAHATGGDAALEQKMADALTKCIDVEAEIDSLVDKLIDKKKEVIQVIEQLDSPIEYDIMHRIYVQYMTLREVADHYGKEYGWATTTHGRALKSVKAVMEGEKHG